MNEVSDWSLGYQAGIVSKLHEIQELKEQVETLNKDKEYLLSIVKMAKETGDLWLNNQDWNKIESLNTKEK